MEFTKENHYSTFLLNESRKGLDLKNIKRYMLVIGCNNTPIEINFKGNQSWILDNELKTLEQYNLKPEDIKVLSYVEGVCSPFKNKNGCSASAVDGYELHIMF